MLPKPNILLITIDALRADHLGCLGYHRDITPNIDKFAEENILFTQAIANSSWTPGSFISIMTSSHPLRYGNKPGLPQQAITLGEILQEQGYLTGAFQPGNPWLTKEYGYGGGFDSFDDFMTPSASWKEKIGSRLQKVKNPRIGNLLVRWLQELYIFYKYSLKEETPYQRAEILNTHALSWLTENRKRPLFLWLHYMDAHYPYIPPYRYLEKFRCSPISKFEKWQLWKKITSSDLDEKKSINQDERSKIIDLYDASINYVDHCLGSFLEILSETEDYNNTLVTITSDHGTEFQEHGEFLLGLGQVKPKLYEELIRVPLIIKMPKKMNKAMIGQQVSLVDLAPTILEMVSVPIPLSFQGRSLMPEINGAHTIELPRGVISECSFYGRKSKTVLFSYRTEEWKYIMSIKNSQPELYNLKEDPGEVNNLYEYEWDVRTALERELVSQISKQGKLVAEKTRIRRIIRRLKDSGRI